MVEKWYQITQTEDLETPALLFYPDRISRNIDQMIKVAGNISRLRPHVKTHKTPEIVSIQIDKGVKKFKCATIAEAEMLAISAAKDVLIAYQLVGANIYRLIQLIKKYEKTKFSCVCDNLAIATELSEAGIHHNFDIGVFIDIDNGMHRTGIEPNEDAYALSKFLSNSPGTEFMGLHVYDGHITDSDLEMRREHCMEDFQPVIQLMEKLTQEGVTEYKVVAGGSPTFPIHAANSDVEVSPGTTILWDKVYCTNLEGLDFQYAAVLATRIISKPSSHRLCLDIGYKAISAEHQQPAMLFGIPDYTLVGHSEEHMAINVPTTDEYKIGDLLYAIPHHICPTVALYDSAMAVMDNEIIDQWEIVGRKRKITI
jgi:D-serine deaminase-like pyridoxal phosphate-dependent protein